MARPTYPIDIMRFKDIAGHSANMREVAGPMVLSPARR